MQAGYCTAMDAPITRGCATALASGLTRDSATGARVLDWPGEPVRDALALRLSAGCMRCTRGVDAALSRCSPAR